MKSYLTVVATLALAAGSCFGQGTMYLLDGSSHDVFTLDLATAQKTLVGNAAGGGANIGGLAYDCSTGTMFVTSTSQDELYTLDLTTFTMTLVGGFGDSTVVMHGIEYDGSTATLYGGSDGNLLTIDRNTGQVSLVGNAGFGSFLNLVYHSGRNQMYGTNTTTDTFYAIDRATGAGTLIGALNGPTNPHGLAYVPSSDTVYLVCATTDTLYSVDVDTGATTAIGGLGTGNYLGLAWVPTSCSAANIDARIALSAPAACSVAIGQQGTFVATVTNGGLAAVSNATVTFTMPAGATFVSSVPAAAPVGNTVTVNLGGLAPAATANLSVTMMLNSGGTNTAQASVTISETDEIPSNNTRSASTSVPANPPATAAARGVASNVAGHASSEVPGLPGVRFSTTGFERPFRSANGERFVMVADTDFATTTADGVLMVGSSSGLTLGAQEGQIGPDGFAWGAIDPIAGINDAGHYVFSNNTTAGTTIDEVIVKWDGSQFSYVIAEGNPTPTLPGAWGTSIGSASIQSNGTVSFQANFTGATTSTDTGVFRDNGNVVVGQEGVTVPTGQIGGAGFTIKAMDTGVTDGQGFFVSADGAHTLWSGTVNDATTQDKVVVVDNDVKIQEGAIINGSSLTSPVSTVLFSHMESNADWFAYGANADGSDYAVRNGVVIGTNGTPITTGSTETYGDASFAQTFFLLAGGPTGSYVVGGVTNAPALSNAVIVLNGTTVVARENDPVDLDNNGAFDDNVYIRGFIDDFAFISGTDLYTVVRLRDTATAQGCSTADPDLGQALIRIPIGGGNPCPGNECGSQDFNGDGDFGTDQDIEAFFACLGGNCCTSCFCQGSDFNGDGDFGTDQDIEAFFRVLGGGNC